MQTEVNRYWPGAETEEDSYCTGVTLEPIDELIKDDLFKHLKDLGVEHYLDERPWDILIRGIFFKSDVLTISRGVLPEPHPIPRKHLPGPGSRPTEKVKVRDDLI